MAAHDPFASGGGVQRFLDDLRSYDERRSQEERRRINMPVPVERRQGMDRRIRVDRRMRTVPSFSIEDMQEISSLIADPEARAACPHCDGQLMLGPAFQRGGGEVRRVRCTACYRCADVAC